MIVAKIENDSDAPALQLHRLVITGVVINFRVNHRGIAIDMAAIK
jgi:hypothetical protein